MPTPGRARPQRHLRRLPQAAHAGGGLPAVPAREGREPRGGGAARREDGRALAERRAARARARPRRPRARRRPAAATTTSLYGDDPRGFKCPVGAHARRANPRDALDDDGSVDVRLHRMIRRGTSYGPMLPEGVLEDDGADRGIIFVFAGAHLKRQFEFVKTQWLNDGIFIGAPPRRTRSSGRTTASGSLHHPAAADPPPAAGPAAVRRHPRRRVLLRPGPARAALAGGARHVTGLDREEDDVTTSRDRHRPLGGARLRPAAVRRRGARARRCSLDYLVRRPRRGDHPQPAARRQRDHHRDGRPPDRDRRDDRGPHRRPGRRSSPAPATGPSRSAATCASART